MLCIVFGAPGTIVGGVMLGSDTIAGLSFLAVVLGVPLCIAGWVLDRVEDRSRERQVAALERSGWWHRCPTCAGTGIVTWQYWQLSPNGGGYPVRDSAHCRQCDSRGVVPAARWRR